MALLTLRVLGPFQAAIAGTPISTLESDKARALLAYLAVEADRPHRREALIGLLWPDCSERAARHNLRQALFNVRQAIGDHAASPCYLLITRDEIQFNRASDYAFDLAQFDTLFNTCDRQLPRCLEDCPFRAARLEEVVELYRGKFLDQFFLPDSAEFEEWALVQREALHQRALDALAYLANYYERHGDYATARRHTARQLELDPWREEAHRQMMRVLAQSGQSSAALKQYETCRRMLAEDLGIEPSNETRELHRQISQGEFSSRKQEVAPVPPPALHNLPAQLTPFIGRERELVELARMVIDPECRLVTLVGPGGIGKTRLALQTATLQRHLFPHGAVLVSLASVHSTDAIVPALAEALGFSLYGPGDPKAQLLNHLREKQLLLVLDNVEHLLKGVGLFLEILQFAPEVKLIVTSREPLNLQGEWVFEVVGLNVPENELADGFENYSAVTLFLQRARRARAGFALDAPDRAAVARICRLVEGMPLALELAATWVRTLAPAEIATEIERNLDFLSASVRDLPERHRSMRAVFDYSWQMLPEEERGALRRLAMFRGGFLREAAEQVAGASLSLLSALVTRSLVRRTFAGRYDLHELVRQYAVDRLCENAEDELAVRNRHCHYYLTLLQEREAALRSSRQKDTVTELTAEVDNLRQGWEWAIAQEQIILLRQAAWPLWYYYSQRSLYQEGEAMFFRAAEGIKASSTTDDAARMAHAYLQAFAASFAFRRGRIAQAQQQLRQSLELLQRYGDSVERANVLWIYGAACMFAGQFQTAAQSLHEAFAIARALNRHWETAISTILIGQVEYALGHHAESYHWLNEGLTLSRTMGDPSIISFAISSLSQTAQGLGKRAEIEPILRDGLQMATETGDRFVAGLLREQLAQAVYAAGDVVEAKRFYGECIALYRELGDPWSLSRTLTLLGNLHWIEHEQQPAHQCFVEALQVAFKAHSYANALDALAEIAAIQAHAGDHILALELALCVLHHPSATHQTQARAEQLGAELEAHLTQQQIEGARASVQVQPFEVIVQKALGDAIG